MIRFVLCCVCFILLLINTSCNCVAPTSSVAEKKTTEPKISLDASWSETKEIFVENKTIELSEITSEKKPEILHESTPNEIISETKTEPISEKTPEIMDTPPLAKEEIRFLVVGDTGTGDSNQSKVSLAMKKKCDDEKANGNSGCDFALMLGDNFYETGVTSAKDKQFQSKFVNEYHPLQIPFYITLGNHDYGVAGLGIEFWKSQYYLDYAKTDSKFVFPDKYYAFQKKKTSFISLNTAEVLFGYEESKQRAFLQQELKKASQSTWKIAMAHHPYLSNGSHGNAGEYDGLPSFTPYLTGKKVKTFFEEELCNKIDFYFVGHDHNRQVLHPKCGVQFVVSGAGAKTKDWGKNSNAFYFQQKTLGFFYVVIHGKELTLQAVDEKGNVEFTKKYNK